MQSLRIAPRVLHGYSQAKRQLRSGAPGLLIAIDFGAFNIRLARFAKKLGWQVLYFMPPASWRRDRQGKDLLKVADQVVTPFPWSKEILDASSGTADRVHFFGHPLKQLIAEWREGTPDVQQGDTIAVLPGSRSHEVERNLELIARIAAHPSIAGRTFEFAVAPSVNAEELQRKWRNLSLDRKDTFTSGDVYGVLARAQFAVVCSGTATLEAALLRCPLVVIYQVTKAMVREAKLIGFKMPEHISLPNIVLQQPLVPEFVGLDIDAKSVRSAILDLLPPGELRRRQLEGFQEIESMLGAEDAVTQTAELALQMVSNQA